MKKKIEFYFDFGSPTSFLAYYRLKEIAKQYDAEIDYKAVLLGGVFKATSNASPGTIPAKGRHLAMVDLPRFAKRYDVPLVFNPYFPINTLPLMRGFYAAKELGLADQYMQATFDAMWQKKVNFSKPENLPALVSELGLNVEEFQILMSSDSIKGQLKSCSDELVKRGGFGVPTLYVEDEMYFGQDRLDFIEEQLAN